MEADVQVVLHQTVKFLISGSNDEKQKILQRFFGREMDESTVLLLNAYIIKNASRNISEIFQTLMHNTVLFFSENQNINDILELVYRLQILTELLKHLPNISLQDFSVLIDISRCFIKKFPGLEGKIQKNSLEAFKLSLSHIIQLEQKFHRPYLTSIFYQGILSSCSCSLFINSEIKVLSTYSNFLPMWHSWFKSDNYSKKFVSQIFSEFSVALILYIDDSILQLKKQNEFKFHASHQSEINILGNINKFDNCADLCVEIFEKIDFTKIQYEVEKLLKYLIKCSYCYPEQAGFYKIIGTLLKKSNNCHSFCESSQELCSHYFVDVLDIIPGLTDNLQSTCINFILNTSLIFINADDDRIIKIFSIALKTGLNNISLALHALNTLEIYKHNLSIQTYNNIINCILPSLALYLTKEKRFFNFPISSKNTQTIKILQKKILLLCCSSNHKFLLDTINENESEETIIVDKKLFFNTFFSQQDVKVFFDKFLYENISIDIDSRAERLLICEIFHTIITLIIGKRLMEGYLEKNLILLLLKFGCDSDDAIKNLCEPLIIQIIHYLSEKQIHSSKATQEFVDTLIDGFSNDTNLLFRYYCRKILTIFIDYFTKNNIDQATELNFFDYFINKIIYLASISQKIAAADLFNYLHMYIGQDVIKKHWLKIFEEFVSSLKKSNNIKINTAIENMFKIIQEMNKLHKSKATNSDEEKLFNKMMNSAAKYLLNQCNSLSRKYRNKCIELYLRLSQIILKTGSDKLKFLDKNQVNTYLETNLESINIKNLKIFLKYLDLYTFLSPELIVNVDNPSKSQCFFLFFEKFINYFNNLNATNDNKTFPSKKDKKISVINNVVLRIFEFILAILNLPSQRNSVEVILSRLWTYDFDLFLLNFTLRPRRIGITTYTLEVLKPNLVENLLKTIMTKLPTEYLEKIKDDFSDYYMDNFKMFLNFKDPENLTMNLLALKDFVKGITILRKLNVLDFEEKKSKLFIDFNEKISLIFHFVKENTNFSRKIQTFKEIQLKEYLKNVMDFLLIKFQPDLMNTIANVIVQDSSFSVVTIFRTTIYEFILKNPTESMAIINSNILKKPDRFFFFVEDLLTLVHEKSKSQDYIEKCELLANNILSGCETYEIFVNNKIRNDRFLNILKISVSILAEKSPEKSYPWLDNWVLKKLDDPTENEKKLVILENFFSYTTDKSLNSIHLLNFRNPDLEEWRDELINSDSEKSHSLLYLQILFRILDKSKSWNVFRGIIRFCCGACKIISLKNCNNQIKKYLYEVANEKDCKKIKEIYSMFMSLNESLEERLDILKYFLVPSFEVLNDEVSEEFCKNVLYKEASKVIDKCLSDVKSLRTSTLKRNHCFVTLIGCFQLLGVAYYKIPNEIRLSLKEKVDETFRYSKTRKSDVPFNQYIKMKASEALDLIGNVSTPPEITRNLNCSVMNCIIAGACSENFDCFYDMIFRELDFRKILDLKKSYKLDVMPSAYTVKTVNLKKTQEMLSVDPDDTDLNSNDKMDGMTSVKDDRMTIKLENDELNDHECAAMLSAVILKNLDQTPSEEDDELKCSKVYRRLSYLEDEFYREHDTINIFLMRIVSNCKTVFIRHMENFFHSITISICSYLKSNPINYLVRDMIVILTESDYSPKKDFAMDDEWDLAQKTIEILLNRAEDTCREIFEYNLECIEGLMRRWRFVLKTPNNLNDIIKSSNSYFSMRVILMLFRHNIECKKLIQVREMHGLVRSKMFSYLDPVTPWTYETLGFIMSHITMEQRNKIISSDLFTEKPSFLADVQKYNSDILIHLLYRLALGCPELATHQKLPSYIPKTQNTDRRTEIYSIFLKALKSIYPDSTAPLDENKSFEIKALFSNWMAVVNHLILTGFQDDQSKDEKCKIYEIMRYILKSSSNEDVNNVCLTHLVNGVVDPDIHDLVLKFWTENSVIPKSLESRLVWIFRLYNNNSSSNFAQFACLLLLDLVINSSKEDEFLFEPLVEECAYDSHKIIIPKEWNKNKRVITIDSPLSSVVGKYWQMLEKLERSKDATEMFDPSKNKLSKRKLQSCPNYPNLSSFSDLLNLDETTPKFIRKYRNGKYPDVKITQLEIIKVLQNYSRYDRDFAESVLLDFLNSVKMNDEIENAIVKVCYEALKTPNDFSTFSMKIIYWKNFKNFDPDDIVKISKLKSCEALGILILEKDFLIHDESSYSGLNERILQHQVHLASLYHSLGEHDMVEAIFKNWNLLQAQTLRIASLAEAKNDWSKAKKNYIEACQIESGFAKDYCIEGALRCMAQLSSWDEINNKIYTFSNSPHDMERVFIWTKKRSNQLELISWIITGQLQKYFEDILAGREAVNEDELFSLLNYCNQSSDILELCGNELSILQFKINQNTYSSKLCLEKFLNGTYRRWFKSTVITDEPRRQLLQSLRVVIDVEKFFEIQETEIENLKKITNHWQEVDDKNGDLLSWTKLVGIRQVFGRFRDIIDLGKNESMDSGALLDLTAANLNECLKLSSLAIKFGNEYLTNKYLVQFKEALLSNPTLSSCDNYQLKTLRQEYDLLFAQNKLMSGLLCDDLKFTFFYYSQSWHLIDKMIIDQNFTTSIRIKAKQLLFEITKNIQTLLQKNPDLSKLAFNDRLIRKTLKVMNPEQILDEIFTYRRNLLINTCPEGSNEERAENYMRLAEYCEELNDKSSNQSSELKKEVISSVLTSMNLGSTKAIKYFPYVLNHLNFSNDESLGKIFIDICQTTPSWMFLFWQEQIVLHLTTPLKPYILPIFKRLAFDYPNAIIYSFKNLYDSCIKVSNDEDLKVIYKSLYVDKRLENFFNFLKEMCQPEHFDKHFELEMNNHKSLEIFQNLNSFLSNTEEGFSIEMPGQYNQFEKPLLQYRVKVKNFISHSDNIVSKKNGLPKIKIVGSDGKTYSFLIKCGTDLRRDYRMQQIFIIVNHILKFNEESGKRNLSVNTYNIVPFSKNAGLIQWVGHTKSLNDLIELSLPDNVVLQNMISNYQNWIFEASDKSSKKRNHYYKQATKKYDAKKVVAKMEELSGYLKKNILQDTLMQISPSFDKFIQTRHKFILSYATMCLIQWLTGVGDRTLDNTLVELKSGNCIGINYGMVFGASIEQPIPELVPFRLTVQILNLLQPFKEEDLFATIMTYVLKAIKKERRLFLSSLKLVINEPLEWYQKLNKKIQEEDNKKTVKEWPAEKKLYFAHQKLNGFRPAKVLKKELLLTVTANDDNLLSKFKRIINGSQDSNLKDCLEPETQVDCLLNLATDANLLGRMCVSWLPFI